MVEALNSLFGSLLTDPAGRPKHGTGILPCQTIQALIRDKEIIATEEITPDQIQPASLDLRLGRVVYRVPASFLPGRDATVMDKIKQFGGREIDISAGAVLERGCVYIAPLLERVHLSSHISGVANPKSSTGRLDIFTRLIVDQGTAFDRVGNAYVGPLYAEIAPRTFSVVVRKGARLNQLRLRRGSPSTSASALRRLHEDVRLVGAESGKETIKDDSIAVSLDLRGGGQSNMVGFKARKNTDVIDIELKNFYDPLDYWEPIYAKPGKAIILNPDDFYILATNETVRVPPDHAAEMVPYDTMVGEFRVHYAGFFDPGFGYGGPEDASKAVLEVRSHEVPFMLEHGQIIGWLRYERLTDIPSKLYGVQIGSTYQGQGLTLSKQFKRLP